MEQAINGRVKGMKNAKKGMKKKTFQEDFILKTESFKN